MKNTLTGIEMQIDRIKKELQAIGEMRPGSLTRQYHSPHNKKGGFYQLSYTHHMKSRTAYVRKEFVADLKRQIKNYKRFKNLVNKWVDLSIQYSKIKIDSAIKK